MQSLLPREPGLFPNTVDRLAVSSGIGGVRGTEFGVKWESPAREFFTSLRELLTGPRPIKGDDATAGETFRVDWIQGRMPVRGFLASSAWHVAFIWLLILPIWGFLPPITPTLVPVQIEMTLYDPPDLPAIKLRAPAPKPVVEPAKSVDAEKPAVENSADAYHPRQTIISIPVKVTHPRQTLIQPDAPPAPPKIVPVLPNIVQWAATELVKPKPQYSPAASAPQVKARSVRDVDAPDVANREKNSGPLNIASTQNAIPRPIALNPMSAPTAARQKAGAQPVAAPEVGAASDDANMRRLIVLSATPAPPAPETSIPQGNLAARISISPEGGKPGAPNPSGNSGDMGGSSPAGVSTGSSSLPAAVSVSAGTARTGPTAGGGLGASRTQPGKLNLKPREVQDTAQTATRGPVNVAGFDPRLAPEKILSGREVYTLHVNLPNLTSASGSWILNFSQLEEGPPPYVHNAELSGPAPLEKADPEYPPDLIKQHIHGEVVLYAIIRKDGSVDSVQIVRSLDPQLDRNATNALLKWKFRPASRAGVPVDLEAVIHVPFIYVDPRN